MFGWFGKRAAGGIRLFNTKGREVQIFAPLQKGVMKIYSCGPTVYGYAHIGNLRSFLMSDLVRRTFEYAGYAVTQVMNVTDFGHLVSDEDDGDDKMTVGLRREGLELTMENMYLLASRYTEAFKQDLEAMNIETPHAMPRASEHVKGMIAYVETLLHKNFAYKTSDGVYFDTAKFPQYGVLGGTTATGQARVEVNSEKRDPRDFALWKFNTEMGWDAPWGKGFPGWHIECTAMSTQYLGKSFDIHTGGVDHIAVHHNNEIAQAEAANGKPYARYWMHGEHLGIDAQRIAKSLGNTVTLSQLRDRNISPLSYRYWLLTAHYRSPVNFTWDAVEAAHTALFRALRQFADLQGSGRVVEEYRKRFEAAIYDDLDTPKAIALMWELLKDSEVSDGDKRATILDMDRVLGVGFSLAEEQRGALASREVAVADAPEEVQALVAARAEARKKKDYMAADKARDDLKTAGYAVDDTPEGPVLTRL